MPITFSGDMPSSNDRIVTPSWSLNKALRDSKGNEGLPLRSLIELFGPKGCLASDTFIQYEIRKPNGVRQNHKGGTIEHLHKRFNRIPILGQGNYQRSQTMDSEFYVPSIDENGMVFQNLVVNVVYSGVKDTYKVTLESGNFIVATLDHELYASYSKSDIPTYTPLDCLREGNFLFIHNNKHWTVENKEKLRYKESTIKYHPFGIPKTVNGCQYYRIHYSHLVYEAQMNGLSVDDYRNCLNCWHPDTINESFSFVDSDKYDVHHKDENTKNDSITNLEIVEKIEHYRNHALKSNSKFSRRIVTPSKIISIEFHSTQDVYDIQCAAPHHNFVANGIVVHNCGKTSLATSLLGCVAAHTGKGVSICDLEIQSRETIAGILDNSGFAGNVHYIQQQADERSEDTVERFVDRMYDMGNGYKNPDVGLFDSIGAYRPSAEFEGKIGDANMGIKAREMGQITGRFIRSLQLSKSPHTIIMTNHERLPFQSIGHAPQPETGGGETKKYLSQIRIRVYEAWIKKEKYKQSKITGNIKLDGAWLLEGNVKENRFGISDQKFWGFMIGGEGLHGGLTAMIECLIMGYAETSAQSITESSKITLDGKMYGKLGYILNHRDDQDMFTAFQNRLRVEMVEDEYDDTESIEEKVEDKPKKKRGK